MHHQIEKKLSDVIDSLQNINIHYNNLKEEFDDRNKLIKKLNETQQHLVNAQKYINDTKNKLINTNEKRLNEMSDILTNHSWKVIKNKSIHSQPGKKILRQSNHFNNNIYDALKEQPCQNNKTTNIKFTEALYLPAICVLGFNEVKADGKLYYIQGADHFAFKLNNKLFHGNIGTIFTDEKNPKKIKKCKYAADCIRKEKCDYYHDPKDYPGAREYRNYIAGSFLYGKCQKNRRFGSRNKLDIDIVTMTKEEIERYYDQTMHDILCSMLLSSYSE